MEFDDERPSAAKHLANMLEGLASSRMTSVSKLISARLPIQLLADVDAFAELTASNRNKALILLLEAGIEAVVNEIEDEHTLGQFQKIKLLKIKNLLPEAKEEPIYDSESP